MDSTFDYTGALGGEIDFVVSGSNASTGVFVFNNSLFYGSGIIGEVQMIWDGNDDNALVTNYTGLGGLDFIGCGEIRLTISSNEPISNEQICITLYSSESDYATLTTDFSAPANTSTIAYNTGSFVDHGNGIDFNNIGAIKVSISTINGSNEPIFLEKLDFNPLSTPCNPIPLSAIPTLGQWGILLLSLSIAIFSVVGIRHRMYSKVA